MFTLGTLASSSVASSGYWIGKYDGFTSASHSVSDINGNVYMASHNFTTLYVFKHSSDGTIIWSKSLGGISSDSTGFDSVKISLSSNDIYVSYVISDIANGDYSLVIQRLSVSDGSLMSSKNIYGSNDYLGKARWDGSSYLYLAGAYSNSSGETQSEVIRVSSDLTSFSTRSLSTSNSLVPEFAGVVDVDSSYYYLAGSHSSTGAYFSRFSKSTNSVGYMRTLNINFDPNVSVLNGGFWYIGGAVDQYIRRIIRFLDSDVSSSSVQVELPSGVILHDLAADSSGYIYCLGSDLYSPKVTVFKFDSSLNLVWQRTITEVGSSNIIPYSISVSAGALNVLFRTVYSYYGTILTRLPLDGSYTGTYTVGNSSISYTSSNYVFTKPANITTSNITKTLSSVSRSSSSPSMLVSDYIAPFVKQEV